MFKKKLTLQEMEEKMALFLEELQAQCKVHQCWEFEYYLEVWGMWCMPWFIEINSMRLTFTATEINDDELSFLLNRGTIELIKVYDQPQSIDDIDRKRYRLIAL